MLQNMTIGKLIGRSLEKILVQTDEQPAENIELETAFDFFQVWVAAQIADGLNIGQIPSSRDDTVSGLGYNNGILWGLIDNFALALAVEFDRPITLAHQQAADEGMRIMEKVLVTIGPTPYGTRVPIGSGNSGDDDFTEDFYGAGQASNAFGTSIIEVDTSEPTTPTPTPTGTVAGAFAPNFSFSPSEPPDLGLNFSSLSFTTDLLYVYAALNLYVYNTSGVFQETLAIGSAGSVRSVAPSTANYLIGMIATGGATTIRPISAAGVIGSPLATLTGYLASSSAKVAESSSGEFYVCDGSTVRRFSSSGSLVSTTDISAQVTVASGIVFVGSDIWIADTTGEKAYRYNSNVQYQNDFFGLMESSTFGLAWDGTNFWEGGSADDTVYRREAVRRNA